MFNTGGIRSDWPNIFQISSSGWDTLSFPTVHLPKKKPLQFFASFQASTEALEVEISALHKIFTGNFYTYQNHFVAVKKYISSWTSI